MPGRVTLTAAAISEAGITTWQVKPVDLEHLLVLTGSVGHDENRLLQVASNVRGPRRGDPGGPGRAGCARAIRSWRSRASSWAGRARSSCARLSTLRVSARSYERAKTLVAAKAISAGEFQTREGDYLSPEGGRSKPRSGRFTSSATATHEVAEACGPRRSPTARRPRRGDAPRLVLRAPFDGRVVDRKVTPGALVEALQPLMTVANLGRVWVFLQAYEKDLALLHEGLSVTIRTEAYPQESFEGRIDFIGSTLRPDHAHRQRARDGGQPPEKLKPGMFVKAHVDVPKPADEAKAILVVPQSALQTLEGRTAALRAGRARRLRAALRRGRATASRASPRSCPGVKAGDVVVTEGSFVLKSEFAKASLAEEH